MTGRAFANLPKAKTRQFTYEGGQYRIRRLPAIYFGLIDTESAKALRKLRESDPENFEALAPDLVNMSEQMDQFARIAWHCLVDDERRRVVPADEESFHRFVEETEPEFIQSCGMDALEFTMEAFGESDRDGDPDSGN